MTAQDRAGPQGTPRASTDRGVREGGREEKEGGLRGGGPSVDRKAASGTESYGPMRVTGLDDGWAERLPLLRQPSVGRNPKERAKERTLWETYLMRASLSLMDSMTRSLHNGSGCWMGLIRDYAS